MSFYKTRKVNTRMKRAFKKPKKLQTPVKRAFKKSEKLQTPVNSKKLYFCIENSTDAFVVRLSRQFNISLDSIHPPSF